MAQTEVQVKSFKTTELLMKVSAALIEPEDSHPLQETPISPALPIDDTGLDATVIMNLEKYRTMVLLAQDFGAYMELITLAVTELQLSPAKDFPKVAAIFNGYRLEQDKKPL
jgi:hypothetical protein